MTKATVKPAKNDLESFRAMHDKSFMIPKKIQEGLAALGDDAWEYELDFIKRCGVSPTDFAAYREQFEDFYVNIGAPRAPKRAWAGSKALAKKMRDMV